MYLENNLPFLVYSICFSNVKQSIGYLVLSNDNLAETSIRPVTKLTAHNWQK